MSESDQATMAGYRRQIIDAAEQLLESGIMQATRHGNISARLPDDRFLLTAGSSIESLRPEQIALFDLDGTLLEGAVEPTGAEIVDMHSIVYRLRPDLGGVVHTHSPVATSFAVAGLPIPLIYEAMARLDMLDGVPVAAYGPRGSSESVEEIAKVISSHRDIGGLLLANHGVLAFGDGAAGAVRANMVIEEAAILGLNARLLGGAREIPIEMAKLAQSRRDRFASAGLQEAHND